MNLLLLFTLVFVPMLLETWLSRRNERALREAGAVEPDADVYPLMLALYPTSFAVMLVEGWIRGARVDVVVAAGFALFVGAKLLKYWAILTLGARWTFRVLVPPDSVPIVAGPYRVIRHPNYVGVLGELAGAALVARAPISGIVALLAFGAIIAVRVRIEERALGYRRP